MLPNYPISRRGSFEVINHDFFTTSPSSSSLSSIAFEPDHFSRSIGIEPNPGPKTGKELSKLIGGMGRLARELEEKSSHSSSSAVTPRPARGERVRHSSTNLVGASVLVSTRRRRGRGRGRGNRRGGNTKAVSEYIRTLNDPFNHTGVKLGFGTLVPTQLALAYTRGSFAPNATDGSFTVAAAPFMTNSNFIVGINTAASTSAPTWTYGAPSNLSTLLNIAYQWRVVSGGLRVQVKCPATSAPGVLFGNQVPSESTVFSGNSTTSQSNYPAAEYLPGQSCETLYRPSDNKDFEFLTSNSASTLAAWNGYVGGIGWPTNSTVWYEVIFHVEYIPYVGTAGSSTVDATSTSMPDLADAFSNIEQMFGTVSRSLNSAVRTYDTVTQMFSTLPARTLRGTTAGDSEFSN